jgi:hypothetical protein
MVRASEATLKQGVRAHMNASIMQNSILCTTIDGDILISTLYAPPCTGLCLLLVITPLYIRKCTQCRGGVVRKVSRNLDRDE